MAASSEGTPTEPPAKRNRTTESQAMENSVPSGADALRPYFLLIKKQIGGETWMDLGRVLGLDDYELDAIDKRNELIDEKAIKMLLKWCEKNSKDATKDALLTALGDSNIQRKDLIDKIEDFDFERQKPTNKCLSTNFQEIRIQLRRWLEARYKYLTMKGMPWKTDFELPLDKYYVDVSMEEPDVTKESNTSKQVRMEDIFRNSEEQKKSPKRILVQGRPGSGKTVLGNKLAYDWAKGAQYLSAYQLVLVLSVVDWRDTWDDTVLNVLNLPQLNGTEVLKVLNESGIDMLLIIDDYERVTANTERKVLSIIRTEYLSHATVVLLSRFGKITDNKWDFSKCSGIGTTRFFDRHVLLNDLSENLMNTFMSVYLQNNTEEMRKRITKNAMEIIQLWCVKTSCFGVSPLELLLLIVTLDEQTIEKMNVAEIHKRVFKLLVHRYISREGIGVPRQDPFNLCAELVPEYNIINQFGELSLKALMEQSFQFSDEDLVMKQVEQNIINAGFVSERTPMEGISHKKVYTATNRAFFQLAAAHTFSFKYRDSKGSEWEKARSVVQLLRPQSESEVSLWFVFVISIMQNRGLDLLCSLRIFSAEYSHYFGSLCSALLEMTITEDLLNCIVTMIPMVWKIPWRHNTKFCESEHHKKIVECGLKQRKIKIIRWNMASSPILPKRLKVGKLLLELNAPFDKWGEWDLEGVNCRELRCVISGDFKETAPEIWKKLRKRLEKISYPCISFDIKEDSAPTWVPLIKEFAKSTDLKDAHIKWVLCHLDEKKGELLENITVLAESRKVEGIQLALYRKEIDKGAAENLAVTNSLQYYQNGGKQHDAIIQANIQTFIKVAATSKFLNRLIIRNKNENVTIDLCMLCDNGKKAWDWVQVIGAPVSCRITTDEDPELEIQCLDIIYAKMSNTSAANLLRCCKVKSLACQLKLMRNGSQDSPITKSLKGLDLKVDDLVCNIDSLDTGMFQNLQVLALTMGPLDSDTNPIPLQKWLANSRGLKRLELWGIQGNAKLAGGLVRSIMACLNETQTPPEGQNFSGLNIKYLLLNSDVSNPNDCKIFTSLAAEFKPSLKDRQLPQLELVCSDSVISDMSKHRPNGLSSWVDVFPFKEGFYVRHDFFGMSEHVPFRSREV